MSFQDDDEDIEPGSATVDVDEDRAQVEDAEDGGAYVHFEDVKFRDVPDDDDHFANLLPMLSRTFVQDMQTDLYEKIDYDKKAREKRDEQFADAIKRTGMGEAAPGGAEFQGASKVSHPMLTEACVDFGARFVKEMMPPDGPCKAKIVGEVTRTKMDRATRKTQFMNWQLTEQIPEFADELDKIGPQIPLGGVQYTKWFWNNRLRRPGFKAVMVDDVFIPWSASSFYSAERRTHIYPITEQEYEQGCDDGTYVEDYHQPSSQLKQPTQSKQASDKVEGVEESPYNEDGVRFIRESEIVYRIPKDAWEGDGKADRPDDYMPYLIKMDDATGQLLGVFRNWKEGDPQRCEINWLIEWPCIPWRGAYAIGLPQIASGLAAAATGALRALLDSALINSSATAIKLKSAIGGQSQAVEIGQVTQIEGSAQIDDIRKMAMPIPFNPPSPVLFELLGFLAQEAKGIIRTSLEDLTGEGPNTPVGTVMARVEQGMVVFSSIHKRLHRAMKRNLRTLEDINQMYLDDEVKVPDHEGLVIRRKDFERSRDVIPVSDPLIFSEAQRLSQVQMIAERSKAMPGVYDLRKAEIRLLKTMKIEDPDDLLVAVPKPTEMNAVNENLMASMGRPVVAFPEQDHLAHLQTHLDYMASDMFGMNPIIAPKFLPIMMGHIAEHMAFYYVAATHHAASEQVQADISKFFKIKDHGTQRKVDQVLALASNLIVHDAPENFKAMMPVLMKAQQLLQALMPPPPADPAAVAMKEIENRAKTDQENNALQARKIAADAKRDELKTQEVTIREEAQKTQKDADRQQRADDAAAERAARFVESEQQRQHEERMADQKQQETVAAAVAKIEAETDKSERHEVAETERTAMTNDSKEMINTEDNQTALTIARAEIASDQKTKVSTGKGLGE